jgi:hypothetical protein
MSDVVDIPELKEEINKTEMGSGCPAEMVTNNVNLVALAGDVMREELHHRPNISMDSVSLEEIEKLMDLYGPETCVRCPRREKDRKNVKPASIRRKFRRWNPNFKKYFYYDRATNSFQPILGVKFEIERRKARQKQVSASYRYKQGRKRL